MSLVETPKRNLLSWHAISFASKCHYLRNPEQSKGWYVISGTGLYANGMRILDSGYHKTPEHDLLDLQIPLRERATVLHEDFSPLIAHLGNVSVDHLIEYIHDVSELYPGRSWPINDSDIDIALPERSVLRSAISKTANQRPDHSGQLPLQGWVDWIQSQYTQSQRDFVEQTIQHPPDV